MNRTIIAAIAASAVAFTVSSPAFASGEQASVDACQETLAEQYAGAELTFKSIQGVTSTRTVTFEVATDAGSQNVTCKVKRGKVIALNGNDLPRVAAN